IYQKMASNCARNLLRRVVSPTKTVNSRIQTSLSVLRSSEITGLAPSIPRRRSLFISRLAAELGCGASLMPLHSATAAALLNSLLSSEIGTWSFISQ
ncbi:hypothetical protein M569_10748, partial [Genlisea aurea]